MSGTCEDAKMRNPTEDGRPRYSERRTVGREEWKVQVSVSVSVLVRFLEVSENHFSRLREEILDWERAKFGSCRLCACSHSS